VINEKASQRHRVILEFGILIQPLRALKNRPTPPSEADYRLAIAQVRGGDSAWRSQVKAFTTFAKDVEFAKEFQDISHVPERLWGAINGLMERSQPADAASVHEQFVKYLDAAESRFISLLERVPVPWQPAMFEANTPFTSYLRVREATAVVRSRLHYFDRYLTPTFFELFVGGIPRHAQLRLITTAKGIKSVEGVSELARREFPDYQLIQADAGHFHDRNLRVDDHVFSLGPGIDRAGISLTNFGPAEDSPRAHAELDKLIAIGTVVHRS
jgi:hypothetical protein